MFKKNVRIDCINSNFFYDCVVPEHVGLSAKRFTYNLSKGSNYVVFEIEADDSIALKAAESSIKKLEVIFRKMLKLSGVENV